MKTFTSIFILLASLALASAQSFTIDRFTIDGGGGTSTGGGYTLIGSIGQPATGSLSGGGFVLTSGFWSAISVVHTPDAPLLSAALTATNTVVVSWPGPDAGWRLQTAASLSGAPAAWTEITPPYATNATGSFLLAPPQSGNRFYRLYRP
jgi:hypothetical protein